MGGKVWTPEEERVFWTVIIPQSAKRLGVDRANPVKGWSVLMTEMQRVLGPNAQRTYTELGLFEHFFQNAVKKRFSPNAAGYARDYIRRAQQEGADTLNNDETPRRQAGSQPRRAAPQSSPREQTTQTPGSHQTPARNRGRPSKYDLDEEPKSSPGMKPEPSPRTTEAELPPFHHPNLPPSRAFPGNHDPYESPAPKRRPGFEGPDGDYWNEPALTSSVPRGYKSSPVAYSHISSSVPRSHGRTGRMESLMHRAHDTPTRKQIARMQTPGGTGQPRAGNPVGPIHGVPTDDDPFVDAPSAQYGDRGGPGGYGQGLDQYRGHGYPAEAGYPSHRDAQMTGPGYDYTRQSPAGHSGPRGFLERAAGRAPAAEMSATGYPHGGSESGSIGSQRSMPPPPPNRPFEGDTERPVQHRPNPHGGQDWQFEGHGSMPINRGALHDPFRGAYDPRYPPNFPQYSREEAAHGAGGYRDFERAYGAGVYHGPRHVQFVHERPGPNPAPGYNGLPPVHTSNNQDDGVQQPNSGSPGYANEPRHGGQNAGHPQDDNSHHASSEDHRQDAQDAHDNGSQHSGERSSLSEQANTPTARTGHADPDADPDADADGEEEEAGGEEPLVVINRPAQNLSPSSPPQRQIQVDEDYDDDKDSAETTN